MLGLRLHCVCVIAAVYGLACVCSGASMPQSASSRSDLVMVTELLHAHGSRSVREASRIDYKGEFLGYAGHYTVSSSFPKRDNHIYAWLQPCKDGECAGESGVNMSAPLLIWLQGGPGGPGWFGAFGEIGSYYIGGNATNPELRERCFTWCAKYNCLFVDQPVNTGFSFQTDKATGRAITDVGDVNYTNASVDATRQVFDVLLQVYEVFPELREQPLVITGESYGGLYTPNLAAHVLDYNAASSTKRPIDFAALAVGDPCINWKYQMKTYANTLYGMGVIMLDEKAELESIMAKSVANLDNCTAAFNLWNSVWDDNGGLGPSQGRGWFARKTGSFNTANVLMGNSPPGFGFINEFLATPEAAKAFHIASTPKPSDDAQNSLNIYNAFVYSGDWCKNSSALYARILTTSSVDLMIYSSTSDPLLGPPTTEAGVLAVLDDAQDQSPSAGASLKASFSSSVKDVWFVDRDADRQPAGYAKCAPVPAQSSRFCYVTVRNAGHETPAYSPRAAYDMIGRFLEKREWTDKGQLPVPKCSQCSGVGPFAGKSLPSCNTPEL